MKRAICPSCKAATYTLGSEGETSEFCARCQSMNNSNKDALLASSTAISVNEKEYNMEGSRCKSCDHFFPVGKTPLKIYSTICPDCGGELTVLPETRSFFRRLFGRKDTLKAEVERVVRIPEKKDSKTSIALKGGEVISGDVKRRAYEEFTKGESFIPNSRYKAVEHFKTAIALKPDEAIFHLRLAATLEAIGEKDEARAEYEEAIKLMPGNGIPYFNLGNMMRDQGNISTALEYYATALSINLESPFRELCSKAMVGLQNSSPTTKREDNIMKEATVSMQAIKKLIEGVGRRDDLGREMSLEEMAALYTTNRLFPDDKEASLRFMQSYMKGEILVQQVGVWPSGSYKLLIP